MSRPSPAVPSTPPGPPTPLPSATPPVRSWFTARARTGLVPLACLALTGAGLVAVGAPAEASTSVRTISAAGTAVMRSTGLGPDAGLQTPEFPKASPGADEGPAATPSRPSIARVDGAGVRPARKVDASWQGLTFRDQRRANGGNQFSVEPPDQGLCVGNGYVLESTNDVLRVYDTKGTPLTGVVDLNTFYGYPAQIDRTTGAQGPFVTDPSCTFDRDVQRWYHVVLTLDVDPKTGDFLGSNHIDIAVSTTADPTGAWTLYKLPVQNDGTEGTPNHGCTDGKGKPGACIGDYPHIGTDAYGFYVTTNEYELIGPRYISANVYAFSKRALAAGSSTVKVVQFDTPTAAGGQPGFTIMPASSAGAHDRSRGGTEYLLSSDAAEEASGVSGGTTSNRIWLWRLTNTASLDSANPALSLTNTPLGVGVYSPPPPSDQKRGDFPLGQCINDTTTPIPALGTTGCWTLLFDTEPKHDEALSTLDSSDSRMFQVTYADGKLWASLGTAVRVRGEVRAGLESFVVDPWKNRARSDYLAVAGNNVTYGAVGVTAKGKAVVGLTLVGTTNHPSAAYATLDDDAEFGAVQVIAAGAGPQDGFSGYKAISGDPPRPRWGDYGAAASDGRSIWLANEYIAQTCTLQTFVDTLGSCGATRTVLGNWATRVSQVTP